MIFVIIDPGKDGAVLFAENGVPATCHPMKDKVHDLEWLDVLSKYPHFLVMEQVSGRPNQRGAMTFAEHNGFLRGRLFERRIRHYLVTPKEWEKVCGPLPSGKGAYEARKKAIHAWAETMFGLKIPKYAGDAYAMLAWALRNCDNLARLAA